MHVDSIHHLFVRPFSLAQIYLQRLDLSNYNNFAQCLVNYSRDLYQCSLWVQQLWRNLLAHLFDVGSGLIQNAIILLGFL